MKPILSIKDLHVEFTSAENFQAVRGINLDIYPGEFVALVGESGSGKTTVSLSLMDLLPENSRISQGKIEFSGQSKSMIFQEPMTSLNPLIKTGKQIAEAGIAKGMSKKQAQIKAAEIAKQIGLTDTERIFSSYPHELSGGIRQRIMIASALITNPDLLIADEPTTALDVSTQNEILKILKETNKKNGTALLLITHDFTVVKKLCTRIYIMYKGKIVEEGETEQVFNFPSHPYTKALISSIPDPSKKGKKLPSYFDMEFEDEENI